MHSHIHRKHQRFGEFLILVSLIGTQFFSMHVSADESSANDTGLASTQSSQTLTLTIGDQTEIIDATKMLDWFSVQSHILPVWKHFQEIESSSLCPVTYSYCDIAISQHTRKQLKNSSKLLPNEEILHAFIQTLDEKITQAPVDAKFTLTDNKISAFSLSKPGIKLNTDESFKLLKSVITSESFATSSTALTLPVVTTQPTIATNEASDLGIVELIGEGRTNFSGSPKNRIHNIKRSVEQFNGLMIAPQQEFSFVEHLGDVDGEHGYVPELVIKKDKTEPEFGGGICQVSSTVFRAAIYSGLKITARKNHAYPVRYYAPFGMDATIYIPRPDLKFINNTPHHILMQAEIEGTSLTFKFYGTSDGRKTVVDGPHILESNPDGSMKTTFSQRVTSNTGDTFINDEFKSNYASPSKFPHPGQEQKFTSKPKDWSQDQWKVYKQATGL